MKCDRERDQRLFCW